MKQKLFILTLLTAGNLFAQTATSVQNGNWTNPMTWSCTCVPMPGYTVIINHDVTLNTSFGYTSGGITINNGASLVDDATGRDLWLNGGSFTNHGTTHVRYFLIQSGNFSNDGSVSAHAVANYVSFTNNGTFINIDSLFNAAPVTNAGSFLNIDSITNAGSFSNNGICTYNQFTNAGTYVNNSTLTYTDITNIGMLTNNDSIMNLNSMWNTGVFTNSIGAHVEIVKSMLNDDPSNHDAVFNNNGSVNIQDSWYNFDTIKGIGSWIVADSSVNYGTLKNNFDFCDLTPPGSAPYIDFNFGTITGTLTWCTNTGTRENIQQQVLLYPNPASDVLTIGTGENGNITAEIYNAQGKMAMKIMGRRVIDLSSLDNGLYFIRITSEGKLSGSEFQVLH